MQTESDIVLLHPIGERYPTPILTRPLSPGTKIQTHRGNIEHEDIIGKCVRDIVQSNNGSGFRIQDVSLGEYARMSKRLVTPVSGSVLLVSTSTHCSSDLSS